MMTIGWLFVGVALVAWGITRMVLPIGLLFLRNAEVVAKNYRHESIPTSYGLVLLVVYMGLFVLIAPFFVSIRGFASRELFWVVGMASLWMALLGWLDDTLPDTREAKGFAGHLRALRKGVLTTGTLKALGGGAAAALVATVTAESFVGWIIHSLLIALMTNWLNLLDLRPGRATKFYLFLGALLLIIAWSDPALFIFFPLWVAAAASLRADLHARLMLGDSGANLLGMHLGILTALTLPLTACLFVLLILITGHLYAEHRSLTKLIARISWLHKLDSWGRLDS